MPYASSRSIQDPDSRVSRPAKNLTAEALSPGRPWRPSSRCRNARTSAPPMRRTVGTSSGYSPALPRTPSVPNNRAIVLLPNPDSNFHGFHAPDADARRQSDAHGNLILTGLQPRDVN